MATAVFYTGFLIVLRKLQSHASKPSAALSLMVVSAASALYTAVEIVRTGESFAIPDLQSGISLVALGLLSQTVRMAAHYALVTPYSGCHCRVDSFASAIPGFRVGLDFFRPPKIYFGLGRGGPGLVGYLHGCHQ